MTDSTKLAEKPAGGQPLDLALIGNCRVAALGRLEEARQMFVDLLGRERVRSLVRTSIPTPGLCGAIFHRPIRWRRSSNLAMRLSV